MTGARHIRVLPERAGKAIDLLAAASGLPKARLKHAMNCGAVWLSRAGKPPRRLRRATAGVAPGDVLDCHYDPAILERRPAMAVCIADEQRYSVWFKPSGLLTQGSRFGDHCSLQRQAELQWDPPRAVFVVHRLDREASGLVLLAHDREAAAKLSALFAGHTIRKTYRVVVGGQVPERGELDAPLDGKAACTRFVCNHYDAARDCSSLAVELVTGRKHQIRRHFAGIGHAVLGDSRYGGRACREGLQLVAVALAFDDPFGRGPRDYRCDATAP